MTTKTLATQSDAEHAIFREKVSELVPKARHDEKAAAELWEVLEANGTADNFARDAGIAFNAERSLIKTMSGDDVLMRQAHERRLKIMRRELAGPNPTELEKLLAERIALCWFHLNLCEVVHAQKTEMSIGVAEFHQKRIDRAQKRYLAAIKALAQVRKLQLPNVQVNIGEKQVNIGEVKAG